MSEIKTQRLTPAEWVAQYVSRNDALTVQAFATQYADLTPVHRSMQGIDDRQAWLDEYSRIQWESSAFRKAHTFLFTVDADELTKYLNEEA